MQDGIYTTDVTVKDRTYHSDIMAAHLHARDESIRIATQQRSEGTKHVTGIYVWKQSRGFRGSTDIWTDGKCAGFAGAEVALPEGNLAHPHMFKGLFDLVDEWHIGYLVEDDPSDEAVEITMYLKAETSAYEALFVGNVLPMLFRPDHWDFDQEADGSKRLCVRMIVND